MSHLQLLARDYPEVKVVALPENRGFTGGNNAGIRAAHGEFIILLNNDTEVDAHWLEEILAAFERHPEAGLVASKMKLFDRRDTFHTAGDFYRLDGMPGNRGVWEIDRGQYDREEYVFSACGGSAAYRKSMLDQIGLLDEDFFYSCEDIDLAWRAQLAGWKCVYAPKADGLSQTQRHRRRSDGFLLRWPQLHLRHRQKLSVVVVEDLSGRHHPQTMEPLRGSAARVARRSRSCPNARHDQRRTPSTSTASQAPPHSSHPQSR